MGYFDGNTVTAMWNYAQHFAMSDNHFATTFGPLDAGGQPAYDECSVCETVRISGVTLAICSAPSR
jgi:hypothetical protein